MNEKMQLMVKKLLKFGALVLAVFVLGGLGGVYFQHYVLPRIRTNAMLSRIDFLKKSTENITIINKTEQITVKEDDSIGELAKQPASTVVSIVSVGGAAQPNLTAKNMLKTSISKNGTGVIVTSDGVLATYRSAILEKDATYQVLLQDRSMHDAKLLGVDEFSNLAFLKIDVSNLPVIAFADSNATLPGKKLIALAPSVGTDQARFAAGLLSGMKKTFNLGAMAVASSEKLEGVFQVDFNEGSEYVGGPVVNYSGELVGINGVVSYDNQPVYFQVPTNVLRDALLLATKNELSQRAFFGAYYVSLTKEYALAHNLTQEKGALVYAPSGKQSLAFIAGSPAEKAGLKLGDVILNVNGQEINVDNPLANVLSRFKKGDKVELTVLRSGQELKLEANL